MFQNVVGSGRLRNSVNAFFPYKISTTKIKRYYRFHYS